MGGRRKVRARSFFTADPGGVGGGSGAARGARPTSNGYEIKKMLAQAITISNI